MLHYRRLFDYLRARFYLPVWTRFVDAARSAQLIAIPADVDAASLYRPEIRPPQIPWIDPLKEVKAYQAMVEAGFRSRQQIIRDLGGDPATVDAQLAADTFDVRPGIDNAQDTQDTHDTQDTQDTQDDSNV